MALKRTVNMKPPVRVAPKPAPKATTTKPGTKPAPKPTTKPGTVKRAVDMNAQDGFAQSKTEAEIAKRKREMGLVPFRYFTPVNEECNVILLDEAPRFFYEHEWRPNPNDKKREHCMCIKDNGTEACPACAKLGKEGYWVMMLTCISRQEYTDKKGVLHKYSRKLFPVKSAMIPKFERLYKAHGNSFRGLELTMHRDQERETAIGGSFDFVKKWPEPALAKFTQKDDKGKVTPLAVPVDYDKAFPYPTADELARQIGAPRQANDDGGTDDADLQGVEWD